MMSNRWRDEQHPSFIDFMSCFLSSNSYRLNFARIDPVDIILFTSSWLRLSTTQLQETFICRISFSIVGVYQWHSYLLPIGNLIAFHPSSAGNSVFIIQACCYVFHLMLSSWYRVQKLKGLFAYLYVVIVLPTKEQNESFVRCYFK